MDKTVDEMWEKIREEKPDMMNDWMQCFSSSYREGKEKSKEEIKMTLTLTDYQTDRGKNFIYKLMSKEPEKYGYEDRYGEKKRRVELAMIFLQVMMENSYPYLEELVVPNLDANHPEINITINFANLKLALNGAQVSEDNWDWDAVTTATTTPLHLAARLENVSKIKSLIVGGEKMKTNPHGYTPLHFAAMAIHPKPEIAKLLIESVRPNGKLFLDKQTNDKYGQNTALHIAAANVNVTKEFIQQFKGANSLRLNSKLDTPFHLAAESTNSQAIMHMLNTFEPTNEEWDVDMVDKGENGARSERQDAAENTLIKICARRGNSAAVALLIKHGADIAEGVLHEIVIESVRNPRKIDKLVQVYLSIVNNAVTWRNLESEDFMIVKGSKEYEDRFRKTMIWLLTTPNKDYGGEDVLQCALTHGASSIFWRIINTQLVFRIDGKETYRFLDEENKNGNGADDISGRDAESWTMFDVTNFTTETSLGPGSNRRQHENGQQQLEESTRSRTEDDRETSENIPLWRRSLNDESKHEPKESAAPNSSKKERNFDAISVQDKPCLTCLLSAFDLWNSSNVLSTQPLKKLTKPYITFVQGFYFIIGLLQLIFMITFTVYWMPTTCSLALMFNVSATGCSSSTRNNSDDEMLPGFSQQRSWITLLWLIWPIFLISKNVAMTYLYIKQLFAAHKISKKKVLKSKEFANLSFFRKLRKLKIQILQIVEPSVFCFLMFVLLYVYFWTESHESYVQVTSLVFLFGWITNLSFLGAVSKNVSISKLVVEEIIMKDISSFMLFFGFTVIDFSFAMHIIRMYACMPNRIIYLHDTFFAVPSSAFGIGDFFDTTITDPACMASDRTQNLFEVVYLAYVCANMIILLNILIAMINNRYEKAKRKAEIIWRFETLYKMEALKTILKPVNWFMCCRNGNKNYQLIRHKSVIFNEKFKRYYLRLLLPTKERLKKFTF